MFFFFFMFHLLFVLLSLLAATSLNHCKLDTAVLFSALPLGKNIFQTLLFVLELRKLNRSVCDSFIRIKALKFPSFF